MEIASAEIQAAVIDPPDIVHSMSRGYVRYRQGDPECEADYRTAFLINSPLAARQFVWRLEEEIQIGGSDVVTGCRELLSIDPDNLMASTRLGLALYMLLQEAEAFQELNRVFLKNPGGRPLLRLMVNEARWSRPIVAARIIGHP